MRLPRVVYAIQHNATKRIYVGSSANVEKRYWNHMTLLRNKKHKNDDMQDDFNKHGENFSLFILDEISDYADRDKEYEWMLKLESHIRGKGYNYKDHSRLVRGNANKLPLKSGIPKLKEMED